MKIDCLGNFHSAPPVFGIVGEKCHKWSIHQTAGRLIGGADWIRKKVKRKLCSQAETCRGKSIVLAEISIE
jgi:hypothetical protein